MNRSMSTSSNNPRYKGVPCQICGKLITKTSLTRHKKGSNCIKTKVANADQNVSISNDKRHPNENQDEQISVEDSKQESLTSLDIITQNVKISDIEKSNLKGGMSDVKSPQVKR